MSTITNKEGLRNVHRKLATNIKGWDMSFEDFAKAMEDDEKRSNVNHNIKIYFPGYSGTDEEFDKALGVVKSDLPSPTDELQQMSKPENNKEIINHLSQNLQEESKKMGIQPPKNEERTFDDLYNSGDIYSYMEKADEQGNDKTLRELNNYAKERRKAEVEAIDKKIAELENKGGYWNQRAISAYKNAKENLNAPSKYDDVTWTRNFVADAALGLWQNLDEEKIPYGGAAIEAGDYIKAAGIIKDINNKKEISEDDKDFLNAFMAFINSSREDTSIGYKGGAATSESVPLVAEMAVAGMTLGGSGAATVAAQTAKKTATKAAMEVIKEYAKKTAKGAAKHVGITAMTPTVWAKEMSQDYFGHAARGEDYGVGDFFTGVGSALLTTGVERGTGKLLSPITKHIPIPNILKQTGKWAKYAALDDIPTEIAEEYIEALASLGRSYIDPIADKEAKEGMRESWKELTTAEGFGTTATSVAIMSLMGKGVNAGLLKKKNSDLKKSAAAISKTLSNLEVGGDVTNGIMSTLANSKVEDGGYALSICNKKLRDAGVDNKVISEFNKSALEYLQNKASANSYMSEFNEAYNNLSKEDKVALDKAIINEMNQQRAGRLATNVVGKHANNTVFTDESGSKTYTKEQLLEILQSGGKTEAEKAVYNTLRDDIEKELPYLLVENIGMREAKVQKVEQQILRKTAERVAQAKGMKRWQVVSEYDNIYERLKKGEVLTDYEKDLYDTFTKERERVAKLFGNTNKQFSAKLNTQEKIEVPPIEQVLDKIKEEEDTPEPVDISAPTNDVGSVPEIDTEAVTAKANATFGKISSKDGNLYEVSAVVNGKQVEGALKGEIALTEDGKLDIANSKGLMFVPKGNGKYTSKAIPLTDAEYNSVTINNVFNKEQYAEQAVSNAIQEAQAISFNDLVKQALQNQTQAPESTEGGVVETPKSTEGETTGGVVEGTVENQVSYPTKKDGSIDYDNLTPEQEYSLTAQEYGDEVAQEDVKSYIEQYQSAIENIQSQLDSKNGTNSRAKMREAMRKNQEKLEAWKALLKEETIAEENVGEKLVEGEKSSTFDNNNKQDETGNRKFDNPVVQQQNGGVPSTIQGENGRTSSNENEGLVDGTRNGNAENGRNGGTDNRISNESNSQLSIDKEVGTNATNNGGKISELSEQRRLESGGRTSRTPQEAYGKYDKRGLAYGVREGTSGIEFERGGDTNGSGIEQTKRDGNATNSERVGRDDNDVVQKVSELSDKIDKELTERGISHTSQNIRLASSQEFHDAIAAEKQNNPNGWMVDVHSVEDYEHDICMLTEDGKAGIAVTPDGDIISVFSSVKGDHRLEKLMMMAIEMGGRKLDCYYMIDNNGNVKGLPLLYAKFGFEIASTTPFAEEHASKEYKEWSEKNGKKVEGVVAMYISKEVASDPVNSYSRTKQPNNNAPVFEGENGYDLMLSHRDEKMKEPKSSQTPEEVVQQARLETVQARHLMEQQRLTEAGYATDAMLNALEERTEAENKFYQLLVNFGVTLNAKTPEPTSNGYLGSISNQRAVKNLSKEAREELVSAAAEYKKAVVNYKNTETLEKKIAELPLPKNAEAIERNEETIQKSRAVLNRLKAMNNALIDMMMEDGDFSFEKLVVTSYLDKDNGELDEDGLSAKDRLGMELSNKNQSLSAERILTISEFEKIFNSLKEKTRKPSKKKTTIDGLSESEVVKLHIKKQRGGKKDVYVTKSDYEYITNEKDFSEWIQTYREVDGVYKKINNGKTNLVEILDENGEFKYKQVVEEKVAGNLQTIKTDRSPKAIVGRLLSDLRNMKSAKGVDNVNVFKDQIKTLKKRVVSLAKAIMETDIDDTIKANLSDQIDVVYFSELENIKESEEDNIETPVPLKGSVADAISKIRTQQKEVKYTRDVTNKKTGETTTRNDKRKENVHELITTKENQEALQSLIDTFEAIEKTLSSQEQKNEDVELFTEKKGKKKSEKVQEADKNDPLAWSYDDKMDFAGIDENAEMDVFNHYSQMLYDKGETEGAKPISEKEVLASISNLISRLNLQDRVLVAMDLEQLKKINEQAYEAEMNGEKVRGFYIPSKHQIVLYVPNLLNKGSVENVIFHEGIAHFGLRELFGEEEFNNFCKQVWKAMSLADKKDMMKYIGKKYVYNQKVSEEDMIAAAEEYVAHLAETPMFAEYLRNRNEQEAVSWINKKWKKVCDLIRKIFKKRTGEELLSSDENIMDALYRSYQLLGSNDYAMFDYYRSLTEHMRKEDVKVGEINEEEIEEAYVNKATLGERSGVISGNSSSEGLLASPNGPLSLVSFGNKQDATKVKSFEDISKATREIMPRIKKVINRGGLEDVRTEVDAVRAVGRTLKLYPSHSSKSYYGDFFEGDYIVNGKVVHLRISTHPATPVRMGNAEADHKVSIVIRKNGEHKSDGTPHGGYTEYVYEPSEVTPQDAANAVVKGVKSLLETGEFVDETGKAHRQDYPFVNEGGRTMFSKVTPEMDAEYMSAVENGDIETAERLVKEAAKLAMPNTKVVDEEGYPMVVYRASSLGGNGDYTVFDESKGGNYRGFYFTNRESAERNYSGRNLRAFFLNLTNPDTSNNFNVLQGDKRELPNNDGMIFDPEGVDAGSFEVKVFNSSQIKLADPVTYDDNGNVIPLSERFNEEKEDIRFSRSNANQEIFVSNAQMAVEGIKQDKATPEQWLAMIEKNGGLKAGEDKWLGLSDWLKGQDKKSITKQEILDFIGENKIQIEETHYGDNLFDKVENAYPSWFDAFHEDTSNFAAGDDLFWIDWEIENLEEAVKLYNENNSKILGIDINENGDITEEEHDRILDWARGAVIEVDANTNTINYTRMQYTTEGLDNKREIALTVPTIESWNESDDVHFGDAGGGRAVAWIRFGETTDSDGNSVLVIDEIQSKRHQEGREHGYDTNEYKNYTIGEYRSSEEYDVADILSSDGSVIGHVMRSNGAYWAESVDGSQMTSDRSSQEEAVNAFLNTFRIGIPSAPFDKNWHELAMKRMLRLAAEEGYDKVAWTTGAQQAERYDIGKVVDEIQVSDNYNGEHEVRGYKNGELTLSKNTENEEQGLAELVGKEIARKAYSNLHEGKTDYTNERGIVSIKGNDLMVGGEGMKGFYDKMLPSFVSKYTKKWGAKVEDIELPKLEESARVMHSVDVTPKMKESVMEGQVMFSKGKSVAQEQGTILFSKGKPAGYVNLSNKFKPQKKPMSALVAREQAVANAVMKWFREMVGAENIVTNVRAMTDVYINALNNGERIRVLHTTSNGEDVLLGFEHNGVHYLDMGAMDSGLLLYELGTVWVDILKKNDTLWERAKEVCQSTKEYKSLVKTAAYKRGEVTEEDVVKEVLAYHISELGTRLGNNLNVSNGIKEEFEHKIGFAFAELKNTLSRFDEYELSKLGVEDFARLSLRDIVLNTSMADSEAVVSDLEDSSEAETPTGKRVKHGTYLRYAPRKNETTGEYLERLQKDRYWNEVSRYGQADVDIAIAVLQSAVEKEMGGQIPEALDVYNMIDSFDSAAYNKINSFENNVAKPYKKLLRKLGKQLKKHPDIKSLKISRLDSVYWYMQAKDIVERQQIDGIDRGRKGLEDALGMSLERYIGLVEGFLGNESINQLWDETNSITDNILMMYKQLGEINDTDTASMKRRFYVPEIGFVDDKNKDGVSGRFAGRQVAPLSTDNKHQIKKSKGRGNSIADSPFYNMIDGSISLIYEIEKRKVQDALIGLAEYAMLNGVDISKFFVLNNEGGFLHDKSKGSSIKVGSPKDASYVYFNEQNNLGKTLQNAFSTSSKKGKYDGVVLWWKNFMSNSYTTWKLAFVFKNLPKDIKATLATATIKYGIGVPAKVSKNLWLKGLWWSVLKYNFNGSTKSKYGDLIKQYYESGAGTGYAELRHEKKLRQLESSAFERKYFNPFTYIELLADLSEGMPRIALYKAMLDSGYTEHSAKIAARNATINFGRQAGGVVADIATTAIPFYRASTSGGEGWLRTLTTKGEEKTSITNHLLRVSLTLTSLFAVGALMALADDEDDDDTDYDEWTDYLLRVNDSPYLGQDRMYVVGVVPSYFAQNHTPFVQAGYDFVRMLQDEKSGYDISVDFITNLLTSTIAANELQQLPVSLTRSIITDESLGDAITKQAIKISDINPISKIARAWVGIDDFGNKRYENKNKSGYGNASGDAAYIYRKIADYAAGTSDMQHPEKAKEQYIDDNGEIQERKLNWIQDINSDKLEDVTNALLPFMEGFISSVSNAAEQLIEREEFDWLEFTKETPVINKVFYNTPKTNLEKLESGYKLMNRYINSYIQGEGDFGSKELKENNKYLRMNAFDDTTDYKKRLEEYEYYIKNYKGNEDIVKKIVERDIKTWKKRRKEMFGN